MHPSVTAQEIERGRRNEIESLTLGIPRRQTLPYVILENSQNSFVIFDAGKKIKDEIQQKKRAKEARRFGP